ncbi:molybdopterin-dependent oxidoreductase [Actinokineospora bangkokensis]|uniref:molybdopterin-dependent oxidoreductase n=1 Tax=Actinokineospora bangkokensis TaxID=1193682 RepID=UPI001E52525F|nr:molybdopterin-dependent oxidoreductase [Actinokineospora bangkokensis]
MVRFAAPAHDERVTARVGRWLGIAFAVCFVTGLLSHLIQHPPGWFAWPSSPVWLYRVTQGLHVITGIACVPLLLAKLWSVYPKLFERPVVKSFLHAVERGSILVLSGAAFFELFTGLFNVAQNYLWGFYFPTAHYAVAWIAIGSILVHVAVKLPIIKRALQPRVDADRRQFLRTTGLATGLAVVATAGATVPLLRRVSVLSWRGTTDLPVNRTASAAGITVPADWRLEVVAGGVTRFSLEDLNALPQATEELPISCVEGWSASAAWGGVRIAELLRRCGVTPGVDLRVSSLERSGLYSTSVLPGTHTGDRRTLLALRVFDAPLSPDHGYPCRVIAPTRPGVLQTKWVTRLEVL